MHANSNDEATRLLYLPLFTEVVRLLKQRRCRSILEVGCGNGFLAELILNDCVCKYTGFDFSQAALSNAGARTNRPELFYHANALHRNAYWGEYDGVVCTEVLEHIEDDFRVIRNWREGAWCFCSVPNFDYEGHVRFFRSAEAVKSRYGKLIRIENLIQVARPINPGRDISTYFEALKWNRNNPARLLGYFGVQRFRRLGGWFVFCGLRIPEG